MLGYDCGYYWFHRIVHEYHFLWALGHSVHHSGEDYNLACALRQGAGQGFTSWPFYLPLALAGFPPAAFAAHSQCNTLYQFWVHTEMVGRLGPLEMIFSTPAAHRMHHKPPGNCNYAGVLIIWDKMFGTYVPEVERMDYFGLASQPQSFNPLTLNSQHFPKMMNIKGKDTSFAKRIGAKRAHHKAFFNPLALLKPMPPMKPPTKNGPNVSSWTLNTTGARREKFDGDQEMSLFALVSFVILGLTSIMCAYVVLVTSLLGYLGDNESIAMTAVTLTAICVAATISDKGEIGGLVGAFIAVVGAGAVYMKDDIKAVWLRS